MKIAICGTRGIPACYGGFETFAEEISKRLVAKGHHVRVYGRKHVIDYSSKEYEGVEICLLWAMKHKDLEALSHTFLSFIHLLFNRVDVILVCNGANSPMAWIPRLFGMPVLINVDGIERERAKWNKFGKLWYRLGEFCSCWFASQVISDAKVISQYYLENYNTPSVVIPYGYREGNEEFIASKLESPSAFYRDCSQFEVFKNYNLTPGGYLLYVSRLEPENNAHIVIKAYNKLPEALREQVPLVVVGDAPYAKDYIDSLHRLKCSQVLFLGYQFGESYRALGLAAKAYIQATEVGGTHPALVEAMGFANCILGNGTPENIEVLSDAGIIYQKNSVDDLSDCMQRILSDDALVSQCRSKAYQRAKNDYSWDKITNDYENLLAGFC